MRYLLDTCVISELVKSKPEKRVVKWIDSVEEDQLFLSAVTIGELEKGICRLPDSRRKDRIEKWLHEDLLLRFEDKILNLDIDTFIAWGQLTATLETQGIKMPSTDSLIAATVIYHDLCLVTRNERDFQNCHLSILNPWTEKPE